MSKSMSYLFQLSHLRLVEVPGHGTNCGGNSKEHNYEVLISVFIHQVDFPRPIIR